MTRSYMYAYGPTLIRTSRLLVFSSFLCYWKCEEEAVLVLTRLSIRAPLLRPPVASSLLVGSLADVHVTWQRRTPSGTLSRSVLVLSQTWQIDQEAKRLRQRADPSSLHAYRGFFIVVLRMPRKRALLGLVRGSASLFDKELPWTSILCEITYGDVLLVHIN